MSYLQKRKERVKRQKILRKSMNVEEEMNSALGLAVTKIEVESTKPLQSSYGNHIKIGFVLCVVMVSTFVLFKY